MGDGFVDVDTLHHFIVYFLYLLLQRNNHILQFLFVVLLFPVIDEEFAEAKVVIAVAECIHLYIFEELGGELVLVAELEEMLNAIEPLVVVEHEEVLGLLFLRHVPESIQGVVRLKTVVVDCLLPR